MKKLILVGGGGHCKVIIDIIKNLNEFEIVGITEKSKRQVDIFGIPIIGDDSVLEDIYKKGIENSFICIGAVNNLQIRNTIFNNLKKIGFNLPVVAHKNCTISSFSKIGEGTAIMANSIINPGTIVGKNCIINTGAIVEHDCIVGENVQISSGSVLCGGVVVGNHTFVGANSTIIQGVKVGENVTIGAGTIVIKDIPNNCVVVGNPSRIIKLK